jgi:hypothetical protein
MGEMRRLKLGDASQLASWRLEMTRLIPNVKSGNQVVVFCPTEAKMQTYYNGHIQGKVNDATLCPRDYECVASPRQPEPGVAKITARALIAIRRRGRSMLEPDFNPKPVAVRIHRCGYISCCQKPICQARVTTVAEKVDAAGRHVRQIELCTRHCDIVIERERSRGSEISDRRDWP